MVTFLPCCTVFLSIVLSTDYLLNYPDSVRYEIVIDTLIANINHKVKHNMIASHWCSFVTQMFKYKYIKRTLTFA
jgi:hypothetical protein